MSDRVVSVSREIAAAPEVIFAVLADPARHGEIDGSGMVGRARGGSQRLTLGSTFAIDMRLGLIPYRMKNTVVEFDQDRLIAWEHFGKHRWRYELEPVAGADAAGGPLTRVTESFDWSTARSARFIELAGYPKRNERAIADTLDRLAAVVAAP